MHVDLHQLNSLISRQPYDIDGDQYCGLITYKAHKDFLTAVPVVFINYETLAY